MSLTEALCSPEVLGAVGTVVPAATVTAALAVAYLLARRGARR